MRIDRLRVLVVLPLALLLAALLASPAHAQPACPSTKGKYAVKIDSSPPGAAIYIGGKDCPSVGVTPWTGKLNPGNVTVVIEAQGYESATKVFKVGRVRKTQELFVPLTRQPAIEVRADADKNVVGATVSLDGVAQGQVQGPLVIKTTAGRHQIEIKKEGFETITQWVDLTAMPSVVLTPALKELKRYGTVIVEADVPDAEVYIDQNKHPDNTTATIEKVPEGVHVVEVKKGGQTWTKTITVVADKQVKVRAELTAGVGVVRVMSDTPGARAFIDSIDKGPVPVDIKDIKAGDHIIQIKAPGYKTAEKTVQVTPGSSQTVKIELGTDEPGDTGTVKIISTVPEAQVYIDGAAVGKAPVEKKLSAGEHPIVVRLEGFKQFEQKVRIDSGQTVTITAELKSVGRLRILTTPTGANVMINGFLAGKTPLDTEVEVGETVLRIELGGYQAFEQTITVEGGKTATISRELAVAGKSEDELKHEQKGLSSFGARTLPRGRSTVDFDVGYPYYLNSRITVGAGRLAKMFGFDATVAVRTMLARSELGLGARAMVANNEPFSLALFGNLWWGSKLFDDSQRNGATFEAGGIVSLTALSNVTISGRGYFQFWSDRHCPKLKASAPNGFDGTDPTDTCIGYRNRVLNGEDPADFPDSDRIRVEELTGNKGMEFFDRDAGARFLVSLIAEIAVKQRYSIFGMVEGAPFQGDDERALFTNLFSGTMFEHDFLVYARFGFTYKF
ncbi:MAG TPA: PEGA domain-containing protein [Kofleriaceae bacterium]|nr:PEGA domain-containing protein [Kofleriaceae bacterium]